MPEFGAARVERRLAAILAADVAGYSRLTELDEEGTVTRLGAHRRELIEPMIAEHRGRLVKTSGDGMLVEFASAVDALRCALDIQRGMAERNAATPPDRRIEFRIGINSGDMIVDGDDVLGDGVNVAARLEALAEPGGICVSGRVREDVAGKVEVAFEDAGEQALKNIARPVQVYRVRSGAASTADAPPALPDRPSIAVLPFQNMSGDPEQDYFADGMVEDITTALSRVRWLFVIARNSSLAYKGRTSDVKRIGRELGVRYVLEGSVRRAGNRVRIGAQLIDAATGVHLWAERFEGGLDDVFDLQDRVTASVVGAIAPHLQRAEVERARRKPTASLDAYDTYLRALPGIEGGTRASIDESLRLLYRAIELDGGFAAASRWRRAATRCATSIAGWSTRRRRRRRRPGSRGSRRRWGVTTRRRWRGPATRWGGGVVGDFANGVAYIERALELDPHLAAGWQFSGTLKAFMGEADEAIARLARAMRLSPNDPALNTTQTATALAHFIAGRYDEAVSWSERSIRESANFLPPYRILAASHALAGRSGESRAALQRLLEMDPGCRIATLRQQVLYRRPEHLAKMTEGLRLAGLPE